jgi:hypothetical protein
VGPLTTRIIITETTHPLPRGGTDYYNDLTRYREVVLTTTRPTRYREVVLTTTTTSPATARLYRLLQRPTRYREVVLTTTTTHPLPRGGTDYYNDLTHYREVVLTATPDDYDSLRLGVVPKILGLRETTVVKLQLPVTAG